MAVKSIRVCDCCYKEGAAVPAITRLDLCEKHIPIQQTRKKVSALSKPRKKARCRLCRKSIDPRGMKQHMRASHRGASV